MDSAVQRHLHHPLPDSQGIQRPLFVLQAANDPRVPASEAEQIVHTVRGNGGEVWYLLAKDEGHGSNRDAATTASAWFLRSCLNSGPERGNAAPPAPAKSPAPP